jgi:hypothetical protein
VFPVSREFADPVRGMAAPVLQIAATQVPQHISDIVLTFILTDPLAAHAAAVVGALGSTKTGPNL